MTVQLDAHVGAPETIKSELVITLPPPVPATSSVAAVDDTPRIAIGVPVTVFCQLLVGLAIGVVVGPTLACASNGNPTSVAVPLPSALTCMNHVTVTIDPCNSQ